MRTRTLLAAAALVSVSLMPPSGHAAGGVVVAAPGSFVATYATPVVVWAPGMPPPRFVNLDIQEHDVVADDTRAPGSAPFCPAGGPRCALFFSELIGLGKVAEIHGLDDVPAGVYLFRCTPHSWMEGFLVVAREA